MKIYFVRHGETDWNKERKIQGQVDIPLNEFGRHLARETAKGLRDVPFDVCFTSPLGRARETAQIILQGRDVPILEDKRILEMNFGVLEGKCCSKEGWDVPDSFQMFFDDPVHYQAPEGGEDFQAVRKRTGDFLNWLFAQEQYRDSTVLVTTHGAAMAGLLNNLKKKPLAEYWGVGVHKNCGVTEVDVTDGRIDIISENKVYYTDVVKPW
ncbi:MAG TPA: histidine phosphatase family protein [Candidatus Dorea merdavium]|nr:histidine phosphatase family protein [Massilistercora timonensis]HIY55130.1 histidine phosphatase family protein [Candidatus Dorea merdavium]